MPSKIDLVSLKKKSVLTNRYEKQLSRLASTGIATVGIESAVKGTCLKLKDTATTALVIYGEPQSGKTEMMICLTAKLLDLGHPIIVHLLNDSVDLLTQNLKRFKSSGLAPAARTSSEIPDGSAIPTELVVLCKKNAKDLKKLSSWLKSTKNIVIIDDEADYATPNSGVNKGTVTKINSWVGKLLGLQGKYIGVTATPARLDLNNTFGNDTEKWVKFPPHSAYTGQDVFFPLPLDLKTIRYRLKLLDQGGTAVEAGDALVRFLVTVAFLNTSSTEDNYTMLVHTSGKRDDHETDRTTIEKAVSILLNSNDPSFDELVTKIFAASLELYPNADAQKLTGYVIENASRATLIVLNSKRSRQASGGSATEPTSPFTIVIGGNIVSRGVTFPNLLSMFFTRNVRAKLQQDTYIQRARMFGARGKILQHFELTIPTLLYQDWHKCFVYHKLALATIENSLGVPVWIGDKRVAVVSGQSIDKSTVQLDKGEISFGSFDFSPSLDSLVKKDQTSARTLVDLQKKVGDTALPRFLVKFIESALNSAPGSLAIHPASSIAGYKATADQKAISRKKGFMGLSQLEFSKFPNAQHHVKIFYNAAGKARVFYKFQGVQFAKNLKREVV